MVLTIALPRADVRVRRAKTSDVPTLARIRAESWREAYREILPPSVLAGIDLPRCALRMRQAVVGQQRGKRLLVAEDAGGAVIGYAWCGPQADRRLPFRGEIYELYLLPGRQGQGVGRTLLGSAIWSLVDLGLNPVLVWVLASNDARHFYESCGGELVARSPIDVDGYETTRLAYGWRRALPLPALRAAS